MFLCRPPFSHVVPPFLMSSPLFSMSSLCRPYVVPPFLNVVPPFYLAAPPFSFVAQINTTVMLHAYAWIVVGTNGCWLSLKGSYDKQLSHCGLSFELQENFHNHNVWRGVTISFSFETYSYCREELRKIIVQSTKKKREESRGCIGVGKWFLEVGGVRRCSWFGKGQENWVMPKASPVVFFLSSVECCWGQEELHLWEHMFNQSLVVIR